MGLSELRARWGGGVRLTWSWLRLRQLLPRFYGQLKSAQEVLDNHLGFGEHLIDPEGLVGRKLPDVGSCSGCFISLAVSIILVRPDDPVLDVDGFAVCFDLLNAVVHHDVWPQLGNKKVVLLP